MTVPGQRGLHTPVGSRRGASAPQQLPARLPIAGRQQLRIPQTHAACGLALAFTSGGLSFLSWAKPRLKLSLLLAFVTSCDAWSLG